MPRNRTFEPAVALTRAMDTFWMKGYSDTSIDDLVASTGVSRYGLYGTFGDKHDLFLKALDHYRKEVIGPLLVGLQSPDASLPAIERFFEQVLEWISRPEGRRGCLMCNTAVELGPVDSVSADRVHAHFQRLRGAFAHALTNARTRGELAGQLEPSEAADFLLGVAQGAFVLARSGLGDTAVQGFVRTEVHALR
jgi:TetR/AcrR family transcriptional repressor of nem operon